MQVPISEVWSWVKLLLIGLGTMYVMLLFAIWKIGYLVPRSDCDARYMRIEAMLITIAKDVEWLVRRNRMTKEENNYAQRIDGSCSKSG